MKSPTRVLFVAWGHSIHAQRRIGLFCEDAEFEVGVVSNYDYNFARAKNYRLTAAGKGDETATPVSSSVPAASKTAPALPPAGGLLKRLYRSTIRVPVLGAPWHEAVTSARDLRLLAKAVDEFKPDVIFLQTLLYPCYLSLFLPNKIPRIITFWNGDVIWWAKLTGAEKLLKRQIVTQGVRKAAAITVNSESAMEACYRYGAAREAVHLIRYPGIDLSRFKHEDAAGAKSKLGYGKGPLILSPRGPAPYQNLDVIVRAAVGVLPRYPDAQFVFLSPGKESGSGQFHESIRLAKALGVNHAMVWKGNVPHTELHLLLNAADISISISSEDSLPNSMLEAMACRIPLVMGDIPPIREWVVNEDNGLLVSPRDEAALVSAIVRLLQNRDNLVPKLTEASFNRVKDRASTETQVRLVKNLVLEIGGRKKGLAAT